MAHNRFQGLRFTFSPVEGRGAIINKHEEHVANVDMPDLEPGTPDYHLVNALLAHEHLKRELERLIATCSPDIPWTHRPPGQNEALFSARGLLRKLENRRMLFTPHRPDGTEHASV